jgi:DNA-binding NarL/FixJ family response regulator
VKDCTTAEIVGALGEVVDAVPGDLVLSSSATPVTAETDGVALMTRQPLGTRPLISKREEEVLRLVATGASIPEVGRRLYISAKTVKNHLSSIYQKLDSHDRAQAVLKAVRMGLIQLD